MAGVREMSWKEKIQPGLRETRCIQRDPSISVWSFFSSHPPWISFHPSTCRIWTIPGSSQVLPSSQSMQSTAAAPWGTDGVCEMLPQIQIRTNCWKTNILQELQWGCRRAHPGAVGEPGHQGGTRTAPASPPCCLWIALWGRECTQLMGKQSEDTIANLKFMFELIVSTFLLHFWSFSPLSGCILFSWLLSVFCPGASQAGLFLWTWEFVLQCFF